MPTGTMGTLIVVAALLAAAAWCFSHVVWPFTPGFDEVLWLVAGVIFLVLAIVIGALLIAAKLA